MKEVGFGFPQVFNSPPKWVIALVIVFYLLAFFAQQVINGDPVITEVKKLQYINYLSNFQTLVLGIASLIGVKKKEDDNE